MGFSGTKGRPVRILNEKLFFVSLSNTYDQEKFN